MTAIKENAIIARGTNVPECLHVHWGLEHQEYMSIVVCVEFFTIRTKVLGAEGTTVPLSNNTHHVSVAKGECMLKVA